MITKMKKSIYVFAVLEADEFDADITFDEVDGDYIVYCIFDYEADKIIYLEDNTHGHPCDFLYGFLHGIKACGFEVETHEDVLFLNEGECPYKTEHTRAGINRYFEKGE